MSLSLVAGLGNPGREYDETRHNLGFTVVDALAAEEKLVWKTEPRFTAEVARWAHRDRVCWLVKPQTYMNESGHALQALCRFHKLRPEQIVAVYDDLTLDVGRMKISIGGSAGGHNGVASLLQHLGDRFVRYRLGIGAKQPREMDLKDYVLGKFSPEHLQIIRHHLPIFVQGLRTLLESGPDQAMNQLNRKPRNESHQT